MQEFDLSFEDPANSLLTFCSERKYKTILADPPWQFQNRTGKVAPEHKRLNRYPTMRLNEIARLPVSEIAADKAHLYLWVPNALLPDGLSVMRAWGFEYKTNIVWEKVRKDGDALAGRTRKASTDCSVNAFVSFDTTIIAQVSLLKRANLSCSLLICPVLCCVMLFHAICCYLARLPPVLSPIQLLALSSISSSSSA